MDAEEELEEYLLREILGGFAVGEAGKGDGEDESEVALDEGAEGVGIACLSQADKSLVIFRYHITSQSVLR